MVAIFAMGFIAVPVRPVRSMGMPVQVAFQGRSGDLTSIVQNLAFLCTIVALQ